MSRLPSMPLSDGIKKHTSTVFHGYDHRVGAGDGTIWDMTNLTGMYYPVLGTRPPRYLLRELTKPNGFHCHDGLYWVDGTSMYELTGTDTEPTERVTGLTDGQKEMESLGAYIVILPDKVYYNRLTHESGSLEASMALTGATIKTGTYAGEPATGNTIYCAGTDFTTSFSVGDAVSVTGSTDGAYDKASIIIREIAANELHFYENTFFDDPDQAAITGQSLTIARDVPDMDHICENENRLWGCRGDMIYASKLGDPFNWNVLDGLSTDSYQVQVGSAGDFTACASFLGYPCFFKEEHIYKVYGDRPSNFQVMGSADLGVEAGSHRSCAIAGETMFYLARTGIVAYSGGIPQSIAGAFGNVRYRNAVGGSDGERYYVSMQDAAENWHLFVYDTRSGMWHREDDTQAVGFGWNGELHMVDADGRMQICGNVRAVPENAVEETGMESLAEFGDFTEITSARGTWQPNKKGTAKIQIRIELEAYASVEIEMMFDSDGEWRTVALLETTVKRSYYLPIIPRRSDHFRIRLRGVGQWKLYSLVREHYIGSEM